MPDGVSNGQVVIDAGGALVGRTQKVQATVSTVLLIVALIIFAGYRRLDRKASA